METIQGEIVEEATANQQIPQRAALAVRESAQAAQWTPSFALGIDEAVERVAAKHQFFNRVMRAGDHYGVIPGTKGKPTLLKPGAELLLASMGLHAEFSDEDAPEIDITGEHHGGEAYIRYRRQCCIYRQTGALEHEKMLVARASGSCSSWEAKYRYRAAERVCPSCGKPAIIKGKKEYGGGWLCFKKKDGCGATFGDNDASIIGQETGKVPNPDIADIENTILKMADKRALVAATLIGTGCSDIFTQDLEDAPDYDAAPRTPQSAPAPKPSDPAPTKDELRALYAKACALDPALVPGALGSWVAKNIAGYTPSDDGFRRIKAALDALIAKGPTTVHAAPRAAEPAPTPAPAAAKPTHAADAPIADDTRKHLLAALRRIGITAKADRLKYAAERGYIVASYSELTDRDARALAEEATNAARCPACGALAPEPHNPACPETGEGAML